MSGHSILRVLTPTLDQVNLVKKQLNMQNQDETISFLCEYFTMANQKGALKELQIIPDTIREMLESIDKQSPHIAKMQFYILMGGLEDYARKKNIKFPQ